MLPGLIDKLTPHDVAPEGVLRQCGGLGGDVGWVVAAAVGDKGGLDGQMLKTRQFFASTFCFLGG